MSGKLEAKVDALHPSSSQVSSSLSLSCSAHLRNKLQRNIIGCEGSHGTESRETWIQLDPGSSSQEVVPTASSISNGKTSQRSAEVFPPPFVAHCLSTGVLQEYKVFESLCHKTRHLISVLQSTYSLSCFCHSGRPCSTGYHFSQKKMRKENKNREVRDTPALEYRADQICSLPLFSGSGQV